MPNFKRPPNLHFGYCARSASCQCTRRAKRMKHSEHMLSSTAHGNNTGPNDQDALHGDHPKQANCFLQFPVDRSANAKSWTLSAISMESTSLLISKINNRGSCQRQLQEIPRTPFKTFTITECMSSTATKM